MKKLILAVTLLALAGSQVQTANAYWGRGGWGWGVGVGLGGFAVGTAVGAAYARPIYYDPYYYGPRPYWGTGFYSTGYYYPSGYNYYYPAAAPAPVTPQPQVAPQNVTINNNYYNAPSTPMSGANGLFGR
jgi:hypothetical protein